MQQLSARPTDNIEKIVHIHGDMLFRICVVILGNEADAEDIVQETLIKYIQKSPVFENYEHEKAWLITVAMVTLPVLAFNVPVVYGILYEISPATAQYFKPVQMSCENNEIKMEVISAYIHDDTAEIYISMQDLTGDRIDETIDLFDSYYINTPFDSIGRCDSISYDDKTKTVTFLITLSHMNNEKIKENKITFYVGKFLSHKQVIEDQLLEIDLSDITLNPETQMLTRIRGYGGDDIPCSSVLKPSLTQYSPTDGVTVTAMGFIDNKLHIQVFYENISETDNHGDIYLKNNKEQQIDGNSIDFLG